MIARAMVSSLVALLTPVLLNASAAQQLDYEFIAPTIGSISYNGMLTGTLQGSGIDVDLIVGLGTPLNDNVGRVCISCTLSFASGAFTSSTPTRWTFAAGGSIVLTGGVDLDNNGAIGAGDVPLGTTLFSGTFVTEITVVVLQGGFRVIGGSFSDTQSSALSSFFGLPTGAAVYEGGLNLSFASSTAPPNAFHSSLLFSGNMANVAPDSTPTPTNTSTDTPTNTPTNTSTNTPTDTPTNTATPTPTSSATVPPTNTPTNSPTNTATRTPTGTPSSTSTPTNTPTGTPTNTSDIGAPTTTSTPTHPPTNTRTATSTTTPTRTPTGTATNTGVPSNTSTATHTPTGTPSNTSGSTSTPTGTTTATFTPTASHTREIVEETPTPQVAIDLAIEKHFADPSCGRGHAGSYVVIVRNLGEQNSPQPPSVTDTLPSGVTLTSASGTGWDCSASTTTVVQCVATSVFSPGESRSITIDVNIALSADAALVNTATVAGQAGELDLTNNTTTIVTLCVGGPSGAPVMDSMGFAIAIALLGAIAYWRLRGTLDE
jgi:hypothetical protein